MERMLMEYLMNSLWQAPLVAGGAWLLVRAGRPGARAQHGMWVAALGLTVALPLLSLRGGSGGQAGSAAVMDAGSIAAESASPVAVDGISDVSASPRMNAAPLSRMREMRLSARATHGVVAMYLATVLFAMMRLLWSWMAGRRIVAESLPAEMSEADAALLDDCCERTRMRRPRVLVSARVSSPLVIGVVRPVLILPENFAEGDGMELQAVWWHEMAHVRRRDYLANLVCRVWALPVAYHPATYAVERRVRQTREMLCDQAAAEAMGSPVGYARCLVGLARRMQDGCEVQGQMGMFGNGVLEERVMELIGKKKRESVRMRAMRAVAGVVLLGVAMLGAAIFHVTPVMARAAMASTSRPASLVRQAGGVNGGEAGTRVQRVMAIVDGGSMPFVGQLATEDGASPVAAKSSGKTQEAAPARPALICHAARRSMAGAEHAQASAGPLPSKEELAPMPEMAPGNAAPGAGDGTGKTVDGRDRALGAEEQLKIDRAMKEADEKLEAAQKKLNSPEFKRQMEEAERSIERVNSAEFRRQLEDAQSKTKEAMERMNSAEFKKKFADAQEALAKVNTPEFKMQMEDAQRQVRDAMEKMQSTQWKQQLAEAQRAAAKVNSAEFKKQMEDAQRQMKDAMEKLNSPEFRKQMQELWAEPKQAAPAQSH